MKKYQIIYADPPWTYKIWSEDKKLPQGHVKNYYNTMTLQQICNLPIRNIAGKDCKLFLWATPPCLEKALTVITSWGFVYKTIAFAWVKLNKNCNKLFFTQKDMFFGIGHWTASNCELCLAGLMPSGRLNRQSRSISQVVLSPRREHSRKPDEVRKNIVKLCGDLPRIELFARQRIKGWDAWGNEVESDIELKGVK